MSVKIRDSTGGPVVKNLPSNAGDVGSIPGQGIKTPHGKGQLGPQATTTNTKPTHFGALDPQLERRVRPATKVLLAPAKTR